MSPGAVHVVGAGLSGLAAAVRLAQAGATVEVSEAAAQAGGRCRSYYDSQLDMVIDNGAHLVLSGNEAVARYVDIIGSADRLAGPGEPRFAFADLRSGERWTLRPNGGPLPWWVLAKGRRVPGSTPSDYLEMAALLRARPGERVDRAMKTSGVVWERLMEPFLLAALNTKPEEGSAALAAAVVRGSLARGGLAYRPRVAEPTLSAAFVDPAADYISRHGGALRLGRRLKRLTLEANRLTGLTFSDAATPVSPAGPVILALPPWAAQDLLAGLVAPNDFRAIVNGHFKIAPPPNAAPMTGLIGGTAEWIFTFPDRISVTVSAADRLLDVDRQTLAERLWADVARALEMPAQLPPWQILKERRATFAATPEQEGKRPGAATTWENLLLAGDWTDTGLPATIEGALTSGFRAAELALTKLRL